MEIETILKLKNDPHLLRYLREHSYWYKYLNRDPSSIKIMEEEMKDKYKLRASDKIERFSKTIETMRMFMEIL